MLSPAINLKLESILGNDLPVIYPRSELILRSPLNYCCDLESLVLVFYNLSGLTHLTCCTAIIDLGVILDSVVSIAGKLLFILSCLNLTLAGSMGIPD